MLTFLDWLPAADTLIFGPDWISARQDIEDPADLVVLVHRKVAMPWGVHVRGPHCLCSPTWRTKGEVESSAFRYEVSTLNGGFH